MTQHPWPPDGGEQSAPPVGDPESESAEGIRFRDKRKVDPDTYEVREDQAAADAPTPEGEIPVQPDVADDRVAELTLDLQRLSAEFANYRRRVDRDRELNQDRAVAEVVGDLMPVLDDIERARSHGELDGGFKAVADAVEAMAAKFGLTRFGESGEAFDPHVHEAMTSDIDPEVSEPTVATVYQVGFRLKEQVLRPARVAVSNPE